MRWLEHKRRIAVTGLAGAGKTVFLLSLLQHLEHFDPDRFRPASGGEISAFRELPVDGDFAPFPRARLRAKLMEAQDVGWPEKTRDIYRCRCSFNYSALGMPSRLWNKLRLHRLLDGRKLPDATQVEWDFLDFPGERLSDVHMIRHDSFAGWSDQLLELWHSYDRLREHTAGYVDALRRQGMDKSSVDASERRILAAYKAALAGMVHDKYQLITPSTFILGPNGSDGFTDADIANHGAERLSGLPGGEFAPLDRQARHDNPELAGEFSYRYQQYRDQVVLPLFAAINHCDRLLLLVDIPGILSGGVGRYNDTNHMIEILAENIRPSGWFFTNVDKAAFIAAKSDMIHPRDIDNLQALVEDMMRIARNRQPGIGYQAFTASAWVSAHPVELADGGRALRGIPRRDTEERVFRVPELRPDWPHDWGPEDPRYSYPLLSPPRLANRYLAPEQHNLDKIFDFIFA